MDTPIFDFVQNYIKSNTARLHMPGHKGVSFLGFEQYDITEIKGADELYAPTGIIRKSEENATLLFDTAKTIYSAGGSSQSINTMLYLAYQKADKTERPYVLAGRNAHKSFIYALAKLDADVEWLYPNRTQSLCSCVFGADTLREKLESLDRKPFAVYITSPDYLGKVANIPELSKICKEYNIPLLVDNAHGSYLKFCPQDMHPIALGADMCCDSAHKTLPVLTGGGYLHIAKSDKYGFAKNAINAMAIFGSTSPSYLILQSLDLCNKYIDEKIKEDIKKCAEKCEKISRIMIKCGVWNTASPQFYEPLKITADFSEYEGNFAEHFREYGIEPEYADEDYVVFMISPQNTDEDFEKIENAFRNLELTLKDDYNEDTISFVFGERVMTIREAIFNECEEIDIENAVGRVCASPTVSCPPAIPIAVSGEKITENHVQLFKKYNIEKILVVK
ncbi:MAG: aminotransferase class V-fold PLP-dependent enzyme [Clostridia bacterium]|nr:aminotransferase class V-fold PLP-dependent enzyme [Clostridia bacterium]